MTLVNPFVNASVKSTFVVGSATALLSVVTFMWFIFFFFAIKSFFSITQSMSYNLLATNHMVYLCSTNHKIAAQYQSCAEMQRLLTKQCAL